MVINDTSYSVSLLSLHSLCCTYLLIALPKSSQHYTSEFPYINSILSTNCTIESQPIQRPIVVILGPNNWTEWIRSIQRCAKTLGVWRYIDSAGAEELRDPSYSEPKDIKPIAT